MFASVINVRIMNYNSFSIINNSEGIDINKTNASKECHILHY